MKIKRVRKKLFGYLRNNYRTIITIVMIALALYGLKMCYFYFRAWNRVLNHNIAVDLNTEGMASRESYCSFKIKAHQTSQEKDHKMPMNAITVYHSSHFSDTLPVRWKDNPAYTKRMRDDRKESLARKSSFYVVDYECVTNIKSHHEDKIGDTFKSEQGTASYTLLPHITSDSSATRTLGMSIIGFDVTGGTGHIFFFNNLINEKPSLQSLWDVTQANYDMHFKSKSIRCDTIAIDFDGATAFSAMYPKPQKVTVSSIEFTDSAAIRQILDNGLRFHAEFIELREFSARRTFFLSGLVSLLVSIVASLILKILFNEH